MTPNNRIIIAAAGAGKTYRICKSALETVADKSDLKVLILTYTNKNVDNIEREIEYANSGVLSAGIVVESWIRFLLNDIIKPYQTETSLFQPNEIQSIDFQLRAPRYQKHNSKQHYLNAQSNLYNDTVAELASIILQNGKALERLQDLYQIIYIDEVQDFNGYSIDVLERLLRSSISIVCVGDPRQGTLHTENNIKNKRKSGKNIGAWFKKMQRYGLIDIEYILASRRCCASICKFANSMYQDGNDIYSVAAGDEYGGIRGVFMIEKSDFHRYCRYYHPQVLRYDKREKTLDHFAMNFGVSKGLTFPHVVIFPNGPFKDFIIKQKQLKSPEKYYVAVTRAKYTVAFVVDKFPQGTETQVLRLSDEDVIDIVWIQS